LSVVGEGIFKNGLKIGLSPGYGLVIEKNGNVKMKGDLEVEGDIILQNISLKKKIEKLDKKIKEQDKRIEELEKALFHHSSLSVIASD